MSALFEDLQQGLLEAIEIEKGNSKGRKTTLRITPVTDYSPADIKRVRQKAGMTQRSFADFMGVSIKTVEAWEGGQTHPSGTACRLMEVLSKEEPSKFSWVAVS